MRIERYTVTHQRESYTRPTTTEHNSSARNGQIANTDTVTISKKAQDTSIVSQLEQVAGLSPEVAEKVASGNVKIIEPNWDTYQTPTLQRNLEPLFYEKVRGEIVSKELEALETQVMEYYAPMFSRIEGMDRGEAMVYLFQTYKMPWLGDRFIEGTQIPDPPDGMSKQEADMAYNQLCGIYFGSRPEVVRDPYALGEQGLARFDNIGILADQTARAACEAAQKELDAQQEAASQQWKEQFQEQIKTINTSGSGTCLGFMALG